MKKRNFIILASLIVFSVLISTSAAEKIEIPVKQSAVIVPPDSLLGKYGPRILLSFDFPSKLIGKEINYAELRSSGYSPSVNNGAPITFEAYPLKTSWESGASWSSPWTNPGGDYDPDYRQIFTLRTGKQHSVFIDVTHAVERWLLGKAHDYGLILIPVKMDGEAYTQFSDPNGTFRSQAKLKIYY